MHILDLKSQPFIEKYLCALCAPLSLTSSKQKQKKQILNNRNFRRKRNFGENVNKNHQNDYGPHDDSAAVRPQFFGFSLISQKWEVIVYEITNFGQIKVLERSEVKKRYQSTEQQWGGALTGQICNKKGKYSFKRHPI